MLNFSNLSEMVQNCLVNEDAAILIFKYAHNAELAHQ